MKYEEIAHRISNASRNNSLTFFVGAGVSKCSFMPSWEELIEKICLEIGVDKPTKFSSDDYLRIPQMYYYSINDKDKYCSFVEKALDVPNAIPNDIHRLMLQFNPHSFLTTNYDSLIESASIQFCKLYKCVAEDKEVPSISGDRFILKVHGDFKHRNFVLKEEDYLAYEENFKLISNLMRSVFSTNTVVFIGYRIGDYNIKLILDWVKRVLKDQFKPIFIHIEESPLTIEELKYYESRGLDVIELFNIVSPADRASIFNENYSVRYTTVLRYIKEITTPKIIGETNQASFDILFNRLKPLDKFIALRTSDVQKCLEGCCLVSNQGLIYVSKEQTGLFNRFIELNSLISKKHNHICNEDVKKYNLVCRVLNKARINKISLDNKIVKVEQKNASFADSLCINFDYSKMINYCRLSYKEPESRCKKAFYLTRLHKYENALEEFLSIAKDSYTNRDYVHFYIAKINCKYLSLLLNNTNLSFYTKTKEDASTELLFEESQDTFENLPQEFKSEYSSLKDLGSNEFLYKYSYEAAVSAKKLEDSIRNRTIELGLTSSGKAISQVNDYLHFLLGNGICADIFVEYKSAVRIIMEKLLLKYTDQSKKNFLTESDFSQFADDSIYFDQYDFYCFINCFSAKELKNLFEQSNCKSISFNDNSKIENSIENLLKYASQLLKKSNSYIEISYMLEQIETLLVLSRYMDLSINTIEIMIKFLLGNEARQITIDQKIHFLDSQLYRNHKTNNQISKIIEDALLKYIDANIDCSLNNQSFNVESKSGNINYHNLANYIDIFKTGYQSRKLSKRISIIIDNNLTNMIPKVATYYSSLISETQRKRLSKWLISTLKEKYNFDLFTALVNVNNKSASQFSNQTINFIEKKTAATNKQPTNVIKVFPNQPDRELLQVGYWCMCEVLNSKHFFTLKGLNHEFDFYIDTDGFDYSLFDITWLLHMNKYALNIILKKDITREKIYKSILTTLKENNLKEKERDRLIDIICIYFSKVV